MIDEQASKKLKPLIVTGLANTISPTMASSEPRISWGAELDYSLKRHLIKVAEKAIKQLLVF